MKELIDYAAIIDRCKKESQEIEQILGKALGYPWYKDDPKNFPNATEADGVCVAPNTAASLAMHAADNMKMMGIRELYKQRIIDEQREDIARLKERNEKLSKRHPTTEEALAQYHWLKENSKRNK